MSKCSHCTGSHCFLCKTHTHVQTRIQTHTVYAQTNTGLQWVTSGWKQLWFLQAPGRSYDAAEGLELFLNKNSKAENPLDNICTNTHCNSIVKINAHTLAEAQSQTQTQTHAENYKQF